MPATFADLVAFFFSGGERDNANSNDGRRYYSHDGITDHHWTVEGLFDTVMEYKEMKELQSRVAVLAKRLGLC